MSNTVVPLYGIHEVTIEGSNPSPRRPFHAEILGFFTHESGDEIGPVPAYYDGDGIWKIRFSPNLLGIWKGRVDSPHGAIGPVHLGEIECVPNEAPNAHGRLRIDPAHRQRFVWEDGTPFVALGFECDWLFALHQAKPDAFDRALDILTKHGFNYVVTNVYAHSGFSEPGHEWVFAPPRLYPWEGTNEEPIHSRLNLAFFRDFDAVIAALHERGIVAHLMIHVQNKHVNWPERYSDDDDLYWRYVLARYQAYGNVVWDVGKESYNYVRMYDDPDYVLDRISFIRRFDGHEHLVTVHDAIAHSPGVAGLADDAADFVSDQIHLGDIDAYNREAIRRFRTLDKPYMNIEYGYEVGAEPIKTYMSRTTRSWEDILLWTWAIVLGGGYPTYYYNNTAWDLVKFEPEPPGWGRYRYMSAFLADVDLNRMLPDNEYVDRGYCLAEHGRQYLVFLPEGGDVALDLSAAREEDRVEVVWMDVFEGDRASAPIDGKGFSTSLVNPLPHRANPCVLYVTVEPQPESRAKDLEDEELASIILDEWEDADAVDEEPAEAEKVVAATATG